MLSADFHIRSFSNEVISRSGSMRPLDMAADGMVAGEACGVVVLRNAQDPTNAISFTGYASNSTSSLLPIGFADPDAMVEPISVACARAGIEASNVAVTHVHAMGSRGADIPEIMAISRALTRERTMGEELILANDKGTFGHSEYASGLVALLSTTLILQHRRVPVHVGVSQPLEQILKDPNLILPLECPAKLMFPTELFASINGTSASGDNIHLVLRRQADVDDPESTGQPTYCNAVSRHCEGQRRESQITTGVDTGGVADWSVEKVFEWLQQFPVGAKHSSSFELSGVDGMVLLQDVHKNMISAELGVISPLEENILWLEIERLRGGNTTPAGAVTHTQLAQYASDSGPLTPFQELMLNEISEIMQASPPPLDAKIAELGIKSVELVQMTEAVTERTGVRLTAVDAVKHPTIREISQLLEKKCGGHMADNFISSGAHTSEEGSGEVLPIGTDGESGTEGESGAAEDVGCASETEAPAPVPSCGADAVNAILGATVATYHNLRDAQHALGLSVVQYEKFGASGHLLLAALGEYGVAQITRRSHRGYAGFAAALDPASDRRLLLNNSHHWSALCCRSSNEWVLHDAGTVLDTMDEQSALKYVSEFAATPGCWVIPLEDREPVDGEQLRYRGPPIVGRH
eukprot:TRINITY_DN15761_c0_g1_i1.p1 TRINITY_DN15761_c0_g1~~TRINITY_DN15761_c0_g1_i1.p1  ORF type:complete len:638 (-),score=66.32 TRINITY_DN15761_c0_g1_i1:282-2195(-)